MTKAEKAEGAIARLLTAYAGQLIDVQRDAQPPDAAAFIAELMQSSSAARITIELPRRTTGVPCTITATILDCEGGEQDIRVLRLAEPETPATGTMQ